MQCGLWEVWKASNPDQLVSSDSSRLNSGAISRRCNAARQNTRHRCEVCKKPFVSRPLKKTRLGHRCYRYFSVPNEI